MLPVYAPSGEGGLLLAWALLTSGLVPPNLSVLGIVGYAALLLGVVCDLPGIADLAPSPAPGSRSWSLAASSSLRSRSC